MKWHNNFITKRTIRFVATPVVFGLICLVVINETIHTVRTQGMSEYQVKAAFLLNFAKFVEWPNVQGDFVIGIVGDDPFGSTLDQLARNSNIKGSRVSIRRLKWNDNLRDCRIVFISSSERKHQSQIIQNVKDAAVLTIGETSQFNDSGGIIRFFLSDDKVRFQINLAAAEQARLRVSSKLLALSKAGT